MSEIKAHIRLCTRPACSTATTTTTTNSSSLSVQLNVLGDKNWDDVVSGFFSFYQWQQSQLLQNLPFSTFIPALLASANCLPRTLLLLRWQQIEPPPPSGHLLPRHCHSTAASHPFAVIDTHQKRKGKAHSPVVAYRRRSLCSSMLQPSSLSESLPSSFALSFLIKLFSASVSFGWCICCWTDRPNGKRGRGEEEREREWEWRTLTSNFVCRVTSNLLAVA